MGENFFDSPVVAANPMNLENVIKIRKYISGPSKEYGKPAVSYVSSEVKRSFKIYNNLKNSIKIGWKCIKD